MKLLYLHLPKAGGSTVHSIIERAYDIQEVLTLKPSKIHPKGNTPRRYLDGVEEKVKSLDVGKLGSIKIIKGHFYFGLHNYLQEPFSYITMIRNPVDRVISQFYFTKNRPNDAYGEILGRISLKEYVEEDYEVNNLQTKILYGKEFHKEKDEDLLLKNALKNVRDHFSFIGITECFDQSLILLNKRAGLNISHYRRQNISFKGESEKITKDLVDLIKEKNQLDMELYNYVYEEFKSIWNNEKRENEFRLLKYKLLNIYKNLADSIPYKDGF